MTTNEAVAEYEDILTINELAARLKMHPVTIRGLKRRGVIPSLKLGYRTLRFSWPDVLKALKEADDPSVQ